MRKWLLSILLLLAACAVSVGLAFGNYFYFQWIGGFIKVQDTILRALLYSSFLIVPGTAVVVWKPRFFGFQIGESLKHWCLFLVTTASVCAFTAIVLSLVPRTPYSGANWFVETILVPASEEAIWRGILFTSLFLLLGRLHSERARVVLAVIYSSIAFGLAHSSNMLVQPVSFVLLQMAFAAVTGVVMGFLRAKAKSVYPAMLLHAAMNLVAILF